LYTYTIDIPAFTVPANGSESVVCIGDVYVPVPPAVNDMCGNAVVPVMTQNADPVCVGDKVYTFTYTDCAGNVAVWTYTFSINDNVAPTGTAPADLNIVLGNPIPAADPLLIIDEADNCGLVPTVVHVSDVSDNGACPETITRTYEIEDACGNTTLVTQLIIIGDAVLPTASDPLPITVECMADVPAPDITVVTDEADNGPVPTVTFEYDTPDNNGCPETITRTYRVTDNCGNFIFVNQTITVVPSTNPVVPADGASTVNCLVNAQVQPTYPVVTDVCGNVLTPVVTTPANIVCEGDMTWVFTYTDCAGNTSVWNYTYTVDLPAFTVPADQAESVVCFADIYIPTPPAVNDFCGNAVVPVMTESPDPVCAGNKVYTFTYTDCAGNTDVWVYTFTINDNIAPTASNPVPVSVAGAILVPAPDVTVVTDEADNCTANPVVAWVSDVSDGNVCNNEVITRTYSITDDCGNVTLVTQEITILAVPPPIDAGPDTLVCADGFATLTADNAWGVPFGWDNGITNGVAFNPPGTAVYTVTADNYGCISTDQVTVNVEQLPTVSFVGDVLAGCEPVTTTFTNNSVGETPLVNCVWEFSNGATVTGCDQVTYTFQSGGLYDVTLTTTSATGCVNSETYFDYVYVENIPEASFTASSTVLSTINTLVDFNNTSTNATDYIWTFGDGSQSTTEEDPTHTFPFEGSGSYIVELIALSPLGCVDTTWQVIQVIEEVIFYVPNTFTPDGDTYNEYFKPVFTSGYDPYDFNLFIYNRWGEIIWESHNAAVGWDGTYGGELVPDGTYTWTIEFKTSNNDERMSVNGHVNVIK
jgi:gliding motility-associated-like protein